MEPQYDPSIGGEQPRKTKKKQLGNLENVGAANVESQGLVNCKLQSKHAYKLLALSVYDHLTSYLLLLARRIPCILTPRRN